jgi:hypothetical protein
MAGIGEDESLQRVLRRSSAGGLRRDLFALDLGDDEMEVLQNAYSPTEGLLEVRPGFTNIATGISWGPVLALGGYKDDTNAQTLLAVAAGTASDDNLRLWKWDGQTAKFSLAGVMSGYTAADAKIEIIRVTDQVDGTLASKRAVIISTDQPSVKRMYYDGTTLGETHWGLSDDLGRAHEFSGGRLIVSGDASESDSIYHSDMQSCIATGMDATASRHFRVGGGNASSEIVTMKVFRGRELIVFMDDAIEVISMASSNMSLPGNGIGLIPGGIPLLDWRRGTIHNRIGCGSWQTVANVGEDMLFMDQDLQIRSLARTISDSSSGIKSLPISEPIKNYTSRINPAARDKCVAVHFERYYILSIPLDSSTEADTVFVLDVAQSARKQKPVWYGPWTGLDARNFTVFKIDDATTPSDKNPTLYFSQNTVDATNGALVMRAFDGLTDAGTAINFQVDYRRETNGSLEFIKQPRFFRYYGESVAAVTVEVSANCDAEGFVHVGYVDTSGNAPPLPQDLPFDLGGAGIVTKQFYIGEEVERCRDLQFRLTATCSDGLRIAGYSYFANVDNYSYVAGDDQ